MRGSCISRMRSRCIFFGKVVLIRQDEQDAAPQVAEVGLRHRRLAHNVSQQARDVHVLLLPVVPEDRLEHILRIGGLLGTFAAKMAHAEPDELRLQLFIAAVLQVPQCQRRKEGFPLRSLHLKAGVSFSIPDTRNTGRSHRYKCLRQSVCPAGEDGKYKEAFLQPCYY